MNWNRVKLPVGKKGKKKKGTTISLNDFLGDTPTNSVKTIDWADETEDLDGGGKSITIANWHICVS